MNDVLAIYKCDDFIAITFCQDQPWTSHVSIISVSSLDSFKFLLQEPHPFHAYKNVYRFFDVCHLDWESMENDRSTMFLKKELLSFSEFALIGRSPKRGWFIEKCKLGCIEWSMAIILESLWFPFDNPQMFRSTLSFVILKKYHQRGYFCSISFFFIWRSFYQQK